MTLNVFLNDGLKDISQMTLILTLLFLCVKVVFIESVRSYAIEICAERAHEAQREANRDVTSMYYYQDDNDEPLPIYKPLGVDSTKTADLPSYLA